VFKKLKLYKPHKLSQSIVDVKQALETVFLMIYPDEPVPMSIDLPHRTLMDLQTVEFLHTRGVLSSQNALVEYANVVGLSEEKSQDHEKMNKKTKSERKNLNYFKFRFTLCFGHLITFLSSNGSKIILNNDKKFRRCNTSSNTMR
jgi:hypothetical protein